MLRTVPVPVAVAVAVAVSVCALAGGARNATIREPGGRAYPRKGSAGDFRQGHQGAVFCPPSAAHECGTCHA